MASVAALLEAETIADWFHCDDPVTNSETYTVLAEGLAAAKARWRGAIVAHDDERAARLLDEVTDLTILCAAAAEGLALQRARVLASDRAWPLARVRAQLVPDELG